MSDAPQPNRTAFVTLLVLLSALAIAIWIYIFDTVVVSAVTGNLAWVAWGVCIAGVLGLVWGTIAAYRWRKARDEKYHKTLDQWASAADSKLRARTARSKGD
jgi:divalent metal cation (Fe/Co/Zn/Cd) transporter